MMYRFQIQMMSFMFIWQGLKDQWFCAYMVVVILDFHLHWLQAK
nr:hypothetical protein Iba_chr12aCG13630 [Ipomoea batatas]GMD65720.1 hypothetical protein Iba_scaffold247292CG0010 [Ipomoea batatas]